MRILIVAPKYTARMGQFYQFPLGLGYIISALKHAGFDVHTLNCNESDEPSGAQVARMVTLLDPQICATGALSPFLPKVQEIFDAARRAKPGIVNIAGGGVLSSDPEAGPRVMDIDIGVIGEGEETIVDVVRTLQRGGDLAGVFGIVYRKPGGDIVRTPARPAIPDLGTVAWPDYDALGFGKVMDTQRASDNYFYHTTNTPRAIDMITSRSCPYRCTFCFHPTGKVYRERPLDDFFAELDQVVARYDVNMVALIDELFSLKKARLLEFCERIAPYKLNWMVQLHVNCADDHILQRMKETGASYISYGVESMSQEVLVSMQKKSKKERIHSVLGNTFDKKIGIQGNLIFGDSAETLETANESMDWWAENERYKIWVNRLLVYPGSPDYIQAVRDGLITDRVGFIEDLDAVRINISQMNDADLDGLSAKIQLAHRVLLDFGKLVKFEKEAEIDPLRGESWNIVWDCPRCDHHNDYRRVLLDRWDNYHAIRLTCRGCRSRYDLRNPGELAFEDRPTRDADAAEHAAATSLLEAGHEDEAVARLVDLVTRRIWYYPGHLELAAIYRRRGCRMEALLHMKHALLHYPFRPELHIAFADHMVWEGAIGMARLFYRQALRLDPALIEARDKLADLDGPGWSDEQRRTYFVSYSGDAPPQRLGVPAEACGRRRDEKEFPDIAKLEETARLEMALAE